LEATLQNKILYGSLALFLGANALMIATEQYWWLLIPYILVVVGMTVFALDKLMLFLIFSIPLSITMSPEAFSAEASVPSEPIMAAITVMFFLKIFQKGDFDIRMLRHPLTVVIISYLTWMFITTLTSELPLVSAKQLLARLWFIIPMYFVLGQVFRHRYAYIKKSFWFYLIPLTAVAIYTMIIHYQHGFSKGASTWVMFPFYKEHTIWGAVLALYIPAACGIFVRLEKKLILKGVALFVILILVAAVLTSYTRAAWVSLIGAFGVYLIFKLRIKLKMLIVIGLAGLVGLFSMEEAIRKKFEKNRQDSSERFSEHVQSISNVSTDASNLERINRWNAAWRMFLERPITGWGPGTYMFMYAPYQKPWDKTIISTNAGDGGNAHSEYLGPLAEMGLPGLLLVLAIIFTFLWTGSRVIHRAKSTDVRTLALMAMLGLITYFIHGFLNNFLDIEKASGPVWAFCAVLVSLDLYYRDQEDAPEDSLQSK
jgi:putative inorganic carbon (HCO3(-)) transporter